MRPRFRWPATEGQARDLLLSAYKAEVAVRNRPFTPSEGCAAMIREVARALTSDTTAFGLMLCGTVGNGKTTLLRAFVTMTKMLFGNRLSVNSVNAARLPDIAQRRDLFRELMTKDALAIDDVGRDPAEVLDYGNLSTPLADLLEYRYDAQLYTFMATNLTPPEMSGRYGQRIGDRCKEMFDVVIARGPSYRGR